MCIINFLFICLLTRKIEKKTYIKSEEINDEKTFNETCINENILPKYTNINHKEIIIINKNC